MLAIRLFFKIVIFASAMTYISCTKDFQSVEAYVRSNNEVCNVIETGIVDGLAGQRIELTYDDAGLLKTRTNWEPNLIDSFTYEANLITVNRHDTISGVIVRRSLVRLNGDGRVSEEERILNPESTSPRSFLYEYEYDEFGQLTNMTDNSDPAGPTDITWTGGNLTTILSRYYVGAEEYYNLTRYVYDLKTAAKNGDYWYGRNVWDADGYGQEASPFHSKNSVRQVITRTYWRTSFGGDQLVAYNHTVIWPKFDVNKNIVEVVETTPA